MSHVDDFFEARLIELDYSLACFKQEKSKKAQHCIGIAFKPAEYSLVDFKTVDYDKLAD